MVPRLLTTQGGSLPRLQKVVDIIFARARGKTDDQATFGGAVPASSRP